mmetsp:Transcript_29085/g.28081  ORF Transcript_29085/g.28081 Transcript_29085/m.28081 type:complete len:130 (+) Transcript_29085:915-1304(+)
MNSLRKRVFKKVKPKVLNGKQINGEMLLELCYAYTQAINKGSVPCIESAWTYMCQNECQRAIKEALHQYEGSIEEQLFKNGDCLYSYEQLKNTHKQLREQCLIHFRSKAVGANVKTFENAIQDQIKQRF